MPKGQRTRPTSLSRRLEWKSVPAATQQLARGRGAVVECDTADELPAAAGDRAAEVQQK